MTDIFNEWLPIILMIVAFAEFLLRLIPTSKNYSITDLIRAIFIKLGELIDKFLPNRRK